MSVDDIAAHGARAAVLPRLHLGRQARPRADRRDRVRRRARLSRGRLRAARRRDVGAPRRDGRGRVRPRRLRGRRRRARTVLPRGVRAGDVVIGLASPGLRCNGYSLARRALLERAGPPPRRAGVGAARTTRSATSCSTPSVIYAPALARAAPARRRARARHVTGGGIPGNLVRVLAPRLRRRGRAWPLGGAADLRRDPARRRRRRRRDGARLQPRDRHAGRCRPRRTRIGHSTRCAATGHDAWSVGTIADGHGAVHVSR